MGAYHFLAGRPSVRCHADEHTLFHDIRSVQRAAEEPERKYARAVALQTGIRRVSGLDRQLHARLPATGPEHSRVVIGPESRARAEVDVLVEFVALRGGVPCSLTPAVTDASALGKSDPLLLG